MKKTLVSAAALACALPSFFGVANVSVEEKVTLDFAAIETAYGTKLWPEIIEAYKQVNPNVDIYRRRNGHPHHPADTNRGAPQGLRQARPLQIGRAHV